MGATKVITRRCNRCPAVLEGKLWQMMLIYYGVLEVNALKIRHTRTKLVDNETGVRRWRGGLRQKVMRREKKELWKSKGDGLSWIMQKLMSDSPSATRCCEGRFKMESQGLLVLIEAGKKKLNIKVLVLAQTGLESEAPSHFKNHLNPRNWDQNLTLNISFDLTAVKVHSNIWTLTLTKIKQNFILKRGWFTAYQYILKSIISVK